MAGKQEEFAFHVFAWVMTAFFLGVWFVVWKILDRFFKQEDKDVNAS